MFILPPMELTGSQKLLFEVGSGFVWRLLNDHSAENKQLWRSSCRGGIYLHPTPTPRLREIRERGQEGIEESEDGEECYKTHVYWTQPAEDLKRSRLLNIPTWRGKGLLRTYRLQAISWQLMAAAGEALFFGGVVGYPSSIASSHTREHISSIN